MVFCRVFSHVNLERKGKIAVYYSMQLIYNGKKWVLYGDDGKVIVITRIRSICERIMQNANG